MGPQAHMAEHALAELVRTSNDAITSTLPDGTIAGWNPAAERLYGYREDEALGRPIRILMPPDRQEEADELFARLTAGEPVEHFETQRLTSDGRIVDVVLSAAVLRDHDGRIAGFSASSHEISSEKRLRRQLQRSEALLESAQKLTAVGSWHYSFADGSLHWSLELFRIVGRDPATFVPTVDCLQEIPHPEERDRVRAVIGEAVAAARPFSMRARVLRPDGVERLVEARGRVVCDDGGRPASIVGSVQDVTEDERARRALVAAEEKFRTAFAEAPVGMALVDLDGRYVEVNAALCDLLSRSPAGLVGSRRSELLRREDAAEADAGLSALLAGDLSAHFAELRFVPDGREVWTLSRAVLVRDGDGRPQHFVCQSLDVTDRRRAEAALRASERRLRTFIDAMPALVFVKDLEGRYTLVNRCFAEAAGAPMESLVGKNADELVDAALVEHIHKTDREIVRTAEPLTTEETTPVRGVSRTFQTTRFPLLGDDGLPYAIGGVAVDVTERRREHDELVRSRALLTEAQRIGRIGMWSWDLPAGPVHWSDQQFRIHGLEPGEKQPLSYERAFAAVHPEDRERLAATMESTAQSRGRFSEVHRMVRADGSVRIVRTRGEVVEDPAGEAASMIGTVQDITRQHAREAAIRDLARRNQSILESVGEGICGVDAANRVTFLNAAGAQLIGRSEEDLAGTDAAEVLPLGGGAAAGQRLQWRQEGTGRLLEGARHPVAADGEASGAVITFRDVSEHAKALAALREVSEDRRRLLGHLVTAQEDERRRIAADIHDDSIQQMSAVALELEAIRDNLPPEQAQSLTVDRLHGSVVSAVSRLRTLLFELAPPELELGSLVAAVDALLPKLARETGVETEIEDVLVSEPAAECRLALYRIAQEALQNVRKHARATRVTVRIATEGEGVLLRVSDDGVGFDPTRVRQPGRFGLVSMHHRAQLADGRFAVESRPGGGTIVTAWVRDPR